MQPIVAYCSCCGTGTAATGAWDSVVLVETFNLPWVQTNIYTNSFYFGIFATSKPSAVFSEIGSLIIWLIKVFLYTQQHDSIRFCIYSHVYDNVQQAAPFYTCLILCCSLSRPIAFIIPFIPIYSKYPKGTRPKKGSRIPLDVQYVVGNA